MKFYHIEVIFKDTFSQATMTKHTTVTAYTLIKMLNSLGQNVPKFDEAAQIRYNWVATEIKSDHYEAAEIINQYSKNK